MNDLEERKLDFLIGFQKMRTTILKAIYERNKSK